MTNEKSEEITLDKLQKMVVDYGKSMTTMQDDIKTLKHDVTRIEKMQVTEATMLKMYETMNAIEVQNDRIIEYNENNYKTKRNLKIQVEDAVTTSHEALDIVKSHPSYVNYETKQRIMKMPIFKVSLNLLGTVIIAIALSIPSKNLQSFITSNGDISAVFMGALSIVFYAYEVWKKNKK